MTNKAKAKGSGWEVRLRDFLRANGHPNAERLPSEGTKDRGDIAGIKGWTIEAKAAAKMDLAGWCDEAEKEARNAGTPRWAVVFPRRSYITAKAYAVIPLWLLSELMLPDEEPGRGV